MQLDQLAVRLIELGGTAAVLWYVLIRLESRMSENTKAITELTLRITLVLDRAAREIDRSNTETARMRDEVIRSLASTQPPHAPGL